MFPMRTLDQEYSKNIGNRGLDGLVTDDFIGFEHFFSDTFALKLRGIRICVALRVVNRDTSADHFSCSRKVRSEIEQDVAVRKGSDQRIPC